MGTEIGNMETTFEFCRMVVPGSMRSPYWKYFGFPSDIYNNILTRKKIICTICNTSICYNKNTTNLRTHLVAKHPEIFVKINEEKKRAEEDKFGDRDRDRDVTEQSSTKKAKIILPNSVGGTIPKTTEPKKPSNTVYSLFEPFSPGEVLNDEHESVHDNNSDKITDAIESHDEYHSQSYDFEEIEEGTLRAQDQEEIEMTVTSHIQDMIIKDLLSPATIKGSGFMNLILSLGGDFDESKIKDIIKNIDVLYKESYKKLLAIIKNITNTERFSLTLEIFENMHNKTYLNIYFVYLTKSPENTLNNLFFKCIAIDQCLQFDHIVDGINLENCSAVVINRKNDSISKYFAGKGIPVVPCLDTVLKKCIHEVTNIIGVKEIFQEITNLFENHCLNSTDCPIIPSIDEISSWSVLIFLKFISDNIGWIDVKSPAIEKAKEIYELLLPLQETMETISNEAMALSSLVQPLILKLTEQHYSTKITDSELILEIKNIINSELTESIIGNSFLSEASFIDPRFHSFLSSDTINEVKRNLLKKFHSELVTEKATIKSEKITIKNTSRKSSLKSFLNRGTELNNSTTQVANKNSLETEIIKYLAELNVDLEQCPIYWWNEIGFIYRQLKIISRNYLCVTCCVHNLYKTHSIYEQVAILNHRFILNEKYLNQLWFLHYNKIPSD